MSFWLVRWSDPQYTQVPYSLNQKLSNLSFSLQSLYLIIIISAINYLNESYAICFQFICFCQFHYTGFIFQRACLVKVNGISVQVTAYFLRSPLFIKNFNKSLCNRNCVFFCVVSTK